MRPPRQQKTRLPRQLYKLPIWKGSLGILDIHRHRHSNFRQPLQAVSKVESSVHAPHLPEGFINISCGNYGSFLTWG